MGDFNYRGIVAVFDLDDTLAFERDYCESGFRFAARWLAEHYPEIDNPEEVSQVMSKALDGMNPHYDALEEWLRKKGADPGSIMPELVRAVHSHLPDAGYRLKPDASELLELLSEKGVRTGLVTDGRSNTQRAKIKALGLERYLDPRLVMISGEVGKDKYSPDNFEAIVRALPEARSFFYAADNPEKDFRHPNLLGWDTFCVTDPQGRNLFPQPDREWPEGAKIKIESLMEIPQFFPGL